MTNAFCQRFGMTVPLIQAPMAGTSTPALAAAVCNAGALGSISVGTVGAAEAERIIGEVRRLTDRPFNVNVFCHRPARPNPAVESKWCTRLTDRFQAFGAEAPVNLREIYTSFAVDTDMLAMFVRQRPAIVSFHFGLPPAPFMDALRDAGIAILATATSLAETKAAAAAGVDAIVAQGYEAGGHRGVFDPDAHDDRLGTLALVRVLAQQQTLPVIAAGGIMDGAGIAAVLSLGAVAAQLGTAFIACPESAADAAFRATLASDAAYHTTITRAISGRPARCLANAFTRWSEGVADADVPDYPIAYDAGKALHAAAKAKGAYGYAAHLAGQGAPLSRPMPAAELVATLAKELKETLAASISYHGYWNMMYIKEIVDYDRISREAILLVTDGIYSCHAFMDGFAPNFPRELSSPLQTFLADGIVRALTDTVSIVRIKDSVLEHTVVAKVISTPKERLAAVGDIIMKVDGNWPGDIVTGDLIEFSCGRIDMPY